MGEEIKEESFNVKCSAQQKMAWIDFVGKVKKDKKEVSDVLMRLIDNYMRGSR